MALEGQDIKKGLLTEAWDAVKAGPLTGNAYGLEHGGGINGSGLESEGHNKHEEPDGFEESVKKLNEKSRELADKDYHYGQAGKEIGRIHTINFLTDKSPESAQKKEQKRARERQMKEVLRQALIDARKIADNFEKLWLEAKGKLAWMESELETLKEERLVIERAKQQYERTQKFELNEHGELKEPELEALIQEYEKQHKTKIDRHDDAALYAILLELDKSNNLNQQQLEKDIIGKRKQVEEYDELSKQAKQVVKDLESDDPELQSEALKKLEELDKASQIKAIIESDLSSLDEADKNEIAAIKGITTEQLDKYSSFSFSAPNITPGFNTAAQGKTEQPQNDNALYADTKPVQVKPNAPSGP